MKTSEKTFSYFLTTTNSFVFMWYPYLALAAAFVPLLVMGIGYMMMGRRKRGETRPGDQESRS